MNYSLVEKDTLKSVLQNIDIILTTVPGTDVHRPLFGSQIASWIDRPLTEIEAAKLKAEIVEAIEYWEPRVKVKSVEILLDDYEVSSLKARLTLDIEGVEVIHNATIR